MRVKYRYGFNNNSIEVSDFTCKQNIKVNRGDLITVFELFDDDENFEEVSRFMENHNFKSLWETVYTQKEIEEAQWLSIRSTWRYAYPQPEKNDSYKLLTYNTADYCNKCKAGAIQNEKFVLKKNPNWNSRNFLMINWVHDELFISLKAEDVLISSTLLGFGVYDVLTKSNNKLDNIKQIHVANHLPHGLNDKSIDRKLVCPECNRTKYVLKPGYVYYNKKVFEDIQEDIIKSNEDFGEIVCSSKIFVSQKFYQVVKNNGLDRGLVFEPIKLI